MKTIHWVLLTVGLIIAGSWWVGSDSEAVTCPNCACAQVTCCEDGVCDVADCDCSCKD